MPATSNACTAFCNRRPKSSQEHRQQRPPTHLELSAQQPVVTDSRNKRMICSRADDCFPALALRAVHLNYPAGLAGLTLRRDSPTWETRRGAFDPNFHAAASVSTTISGRNLRKHDRPRSPRKCQSNQTLRLRCSEGGSRGSSVGASVDRFRSPQSGSPTELTQYKSLSALQPSSSRIASDTGA